MEMNTIPRKNIVKRDHPRDKGVQRVLSRNLTPKRNRARLVESKSGNRHYIVSISNYQIENFVQKLCAYKFFWCFLSCAVGLGSTTVLLLQLFIQHPLSLISSSSHLYLGVGVQGLTIDFIL